MIISKTRKFVFVHIHKTAGESITSALAGQLGPGDLVIGSTPMGKLRNIQYKRRYGLEKHSHATKIREFLGPETWESYFSFAFVRHPFERTESLYRYFAMVSEKRDAGGLRNLRFKLPYFSGSDPLIWPGMTAYRETETFSEFIRHPSFFRDPASRCQCDAVQDETGATIVDFIGYFGQHESDFARVAERLELPDLRLPRKNISTGATARESLIGPADREHLREVFARDFAAFTFPERG
ncbi:sulfotransferase family 2 domain-containing protein [Amaricoccus macauensis]|uniref:sulfotransferase family 2 domain-containing protein n=1 Tax=Amaricoccus macauensis TaxID=57001 RepID=UPI003C7DC39F